MAKLPDDDTFSGAASVLAAPDDTVPVGARAGLRLLIYDRRSIWRRGRLDLTPIWALGGVLYRVLRRIDHTCGVASWAEALHWLAKVRRGRPIEEIQFWGHGLWGLAMIGEDRLDRITAAGDHAAALAALRARLLPDGNALFWFRTCQTLGARPGQVFAQELADRLACRVAGHTYVIASYQSGLHSLAPGCEPSWAPDEGLELGSPDDPQKAKWSRRHEPNTITFLHGKIPAGY
ncbi:MAG TPA: hypothetical protein VFG69_10945 [Nannocystaceae bacterium]|nr:hypothetical protein [Nannocystaceae bacterium]